MASLKKILEYFVDILPVILTLYLLVSLVVFRFNHPEMTETQLFLNIFTALTWSW